jgi:inner membrane protein
VNPITHALTGWCLAECAPSLTMRERAVVVAGGVAPDVDGFGILVELATRDSAHPLLWWSEYHHALAHTLPFAVLFAGVAYAITRRVLPTLLAFAAVHLHLFCDLLGSRGPDGYQWPIPYLAPFSSVELSWSGEWALNAWQNIVITIVLLAATFVLAARRGYSPVGMFSTRADAAFVATLRRRFTRTHGIQ